MCKRAAGIVGHCLRARATPELDRIFEKHLLRWLKTAEYLSCLESNPVGDGVDIAILRKRRHDYVQDKANEARIQEEIKQVSSDICRACSQWQGWDLERKRRLIRLVTDAITMEELADGWLRLTVTWSAVLGGLTEHCYILRATGSQWSQADVERLYKLYPTASKSELLHIFPTRSWHAIQRRAIVSKVRRTVIDRDVTIPLDTSLSDYEVVQRYGVEPGKRVQWLRGAVGNGVFPS